MADSVEDVLADLLGFDEDPPVPPSCGSRLTCIQVSSRGALEEDPGGKFPEDDVGETQDLDDLDAEILGISRSRPRLAGAGTGAGKSLGKQLDPEEGAPSVPPGVASVTSWIPREEPGKPRECRTGKILEQPEKGESGTEKGESRTDPEELEQPGPWEELDFPVGSYEPSVASEGRPGQRRGHRIPGGIGLFPKVPRGSGGGAAWLGLKDEEFPGSGARDEDFLGLGPKDKDIPGLGSRNEDFLGLGPKDENFPRLGPKDKEFPGLEPKDKEFPGLGLKDKNFPRSEPKDKDFPGLGSKDKDLPGLGSRNEDFPGLGLKDKEFPGLGLKDKNFPRLGPKDKDIPGLGSKNEDFPGLGPKDENFPRLGPKDKEFSGLGPKDKDFPGLGSKDKKLPRSEPKDEDFPGLGSRDEDFLGLEPLAGADPGPTLEQNWLSSVLARKRARERHSQPSGSPGKEPEGVEEMDQHSRESRRCPSQDTILQSQPFQKDPGALPSQPFQRDPGALPAPPLQDPGAFPSQPFQRDPGALPSQPFQRDPGAFPSQPFQRDPGAFPSQPFQRDPGAFPSWPFPAPGAFLAFPANPGSGSILGTLPARVAELELQVRALELERSLFLESLQRRHQDLDLLESPHRSPGKVGEEQRERPRILTRSQDGSSPPCQDHSPSQDLPLSKDHPTAQDHCQDPSTAQDHPRSRDHPPSQERDEQLTVLQARLCQQQQEQSRLQEALAALESRLGEQEQLLEQERRRAEAEHSKAESLRKALEEQRQLSAQLLSMERAALDEAKGAWLEEQRVALRECSEGRRRLEKAWAEFQSRERLSQERSEHLESALRNLDKEQAALRFRARELRSQEERLEREREALEDSRRELRLDREKVLRDTERLRQREQEVQALAELSERRSRDGERALREARNVEAEQRERLRAGREQLEQLREQEQRLEQDRLSLAQQRRQLQRLRQELSPQELSVPGAGTLLGTARERPIPKDVIPGDRLHIPLAPAAPGTPGLLPGFLPPVGMILGGTRDTLSGSAALQGHLLLLKHRARMDHDFLESESFFLENLRKGP